MHVCCISYPDTRDYDAHMYNALIQSMMRVSMILDHGTCTYDAYIYHDTRDYDAHMNDVFIH